MAERSEAGGGFRVLDGVSLVTGAAVALVHLRPAVAEFDDASDWAWGCGLFAWMTLASAGPFVFLVRRFFTRPAGYPRLGDRLWVLSGIPWILAALVRTADPLAGGGSGRVDPAYVGALGLGLCLAVMAGVPRVAALYLLGDPSRPRPTEPTPWTHRLGLMMTVAWPIQCGVGLVMMG